MKCIKNYKLFLFLICSQFTIAVNAQEFLTPLTSNQQIKKYIIEHPKSVERIASGDTLDLPFIDDFSSASVYPDPQKWADNMVYINSTFSRNALSFGVATFDGLDAFGNAYDRVNTNSSGYADTLTSMPFYLLTKPSSLGGGQYTLSDSLTLSFYYERKGFGDPTEPSDSLLVEYFNPDLSQWTEKWSADGSITANNDTYFKKVDLRILSTDFLKDGFRFRFRSYGGLSGSMDNWNIDYVRLYKAKNILNVMDTALVDIAFTEQGKSQLDGYTSIPWDHFKTLSSSAQQLLVKDSLTLSYRVNDVQNEDVGFNNRNYDFAGNYVSGFGAPNGNILVNRSKNVALNYSLPVDSLFPNSPSFSDDSTSFRIVNYFSNSNTFSGGISSNDTVSYDQLFYNYYSYDDGSCEQGYDLLNAPGGKVCMQFDIIKPDTLRAIRIMFAQELANVQNKLMNLRIWSSITPETVIYTQANMRPVYVDSINGFSTYVLNNILPVSGRIFVGFEQQTADPLHLGFDKNTNSNAKMYYNINDGTGWHNVAAAAGSFMMRPVMGGASLFIGLEESKSQLSNVTVCPNPASDHLSIQFNKQEKIRSVEIVSMQGKIIGVSDFQPVIDIKYFADGMYILKVTLVNGNMITKKFVKKSN